MLEEFRNYGQVRWARRAFRQRRCLRGTREENRYEGRVHVISRQKKFPFLSFFFLIVQSINPRFKASVSSLTTFLFAPFHSFQSIPHLLSFTSVLENCIILDDLKIGFLLLFSFPFFLIYSYYFGQFFNGAFSFSSPIYLHSFQFLSLL